MPKTTLNKINLALTVVFVLLLGANHYVQRANAAFGIPGLACPPDNPDEVTKFPNPGDCSSYFLCDNFELKLVECPPGLIFCEELKACDWPDDMMCTYNCIYEGFDSGGSGGNQDCPLDNFSTYQYVSNTAETFEIYTHIYGEINNGTDIKMTATRVHCVALYNGSLKGTNVSYTKNISLGEYVPCTGQCRNYWF